MWNGAKFIHVKYSYLLTYILTNILTSHVSRSLMVSVGVSVLGTTNIHFIEPGVKVNGQYYREDLLMQKLLPTVRLLRVSTRQCASPYGSWDNWAFGHQTARIYYPVDYKVWSVMQEGLQEADQGHWRTACTYPDSLGRNGSAHYWCSNQRVAHTSSYMH